MKSVVYIAPQDNVFLDFHSYNIVLWLIMIIRCSRPFEKSLTLSI